MHLFGQNIAIIINTIMLFIVYLVGVGITSIIAKIVGKHFMGMRLKKGKDGTYWKDLNLKKKEMDEYYRQF